ncbi:hypothetical protein QYF61_003157 [Mycteria americana]|uniref:Uncharacterized protein n=1 Tax=Mycteria americana TaxID=33587 RepID=A0AAN7NDL6_MYCAM|nr:hypothetical protein QYF61_003157 [Mycteria americana]
MVGLDDLKGLFQPKRFYDSILSRKVLFAAIAHIQAQRSVCRSPGEDGLVRNSRQVLQWGMVSVAQPVWEVLGMLTVTPEELLCRGYQMNGSKLLSQQLCAVDLLLSTLLTGRTQLLAKRVPASSAATGGGIAESEQCKAKVPGWVGTAPQSLPVPLMVAAEALPSLLACTGVGGEASTHRAQSVMALSTGPGNICPSAMLSEEPPHKAHLFWEGGRHAASFTAEANQPFAKVTSRQERDVPAAKGSLPAPRAHMAKKGKQISREGLWREY